MCECHLQVVVCLIPFVSKALERNRKSRFIDVDKGVWKDSVEIAFPKKLRVQRVESTPFVPPKSSFPVFFDLLNQT